MPSSGQIVPYNPHELAQLAYDALPAYRQVRENLNALMERAQQGPEVINATILEDKDLSKNPTLIQYIGAIHVTNNYYSQPQPFGFSDHSVYPGHSSTNLGYVPPVNLSAPVYYEAPKIDFKPIIHVHVDPSIHTSSQSYSHSESNGYEDDRSPFLLFLIFGVFCIGIIGASNGR